MRRAFVEWVAVNALCWLLGHAWEPTEFGGSYCRTCDERRDFHR